MIDWLLVLVAVLGGDDPGCLVLDALDERRAHALEHDDPDALARVYPPGSPLLAADRAVLDAYRERGLRLRGGGVERLACRTTREHAGRYEVDVVDRLAETTVETPDGRRTLPRDRPTRHVVTLAWTPDGWRVERVR